MKKADVFVILALLLAGAAAFALRSGGRAGIARVYCDGEVVWEHALNADAQFSVSGVTVVIENGYAYVSEADCPDMSCVKSGRISRAGQSVVCLPNRVSLVLYGGDAPDAVIG